MFEIEQYKINGSTHRAALELIKQQQHNGKKYRIIGSGAFGTVYGVKGSPLVYKIGQASDSDGYFAYVKELQKSKTHNKFTPVIHAVRVFQNNKSVYDRTFVVAMERLDRINTADEYSVRDDIADALRSNKKTGVFRDLVALVRRAKKKAHAGFDLHFGNFMSRNGQVVLTDPLA